MTTYTIDWLSYTYDRDVTPSRRSPIPQDLHKFAHMEVDTKWKSATPRFGYSAAYSPSSCPGPVVYCWPQGERSHTHVQWSGSALAWHGQAHTLLSEVVPRVARVTRLDLAVDIMDGDPLDVWFAAGRDEVKSRLRKRTMVTSDTGVTVYIGSRSSGRYVRVYDKAGQLGVPGPWVRVELELKGDDAHGIARYVVQEGVHVIPSTVRAVIDCPTLPWWRAAFDGHDAVWGAPKTERFTDRPAWIIKQVIPALIDLHRTDEQAFTQVYTVLRSRVGEATGHWGLPFDGDAVERYTEVSTEPDQS